MTRKDFLQTMSGAAALIPGALATAGLSPFVSAAVPKNNIKRGVTSYSYRDLFRAKQMTLEDYLKEASDIGAYGLETNLSGLVPGFPNPSDKWVGQWFELMEKYHTVPIADSQYLEQYITRTHAQTVDEAVSNIESDLKIAKRLGFKYIRVLPMVSVEVLDKAAPLGEKYGVSLSLEIHPPMNLDGALFNKWVEIIHKHQGKGIGMTLDFGVFQYRPRYPQRDGAIREGTLTEAIVNYVEKAKADGVPKEAVAAEVAKRSSKPGDVKYVDTFYSVKMEDPKLLLPHLAHILDSHAKFWGVGEDLHDYSIAYDKVIPVLIQGGYSGYLMSEYEGTPVMGSDGLMTTPVEEVRRQQVMLRRLLGEI